MPLADVFEAGSYLMIDSTLVDGFIRHLSVVYTKTKEKPRSEVGSFNYFVRTCLKHIEW